MKLGRRIPVLVVALVALAATMSCRGELGQPNNPVTLYVVPSEENSREAAEKLRAHLETASGLSVQLKVPPRYFDLVVAVGAEEADLLFMNDVSYLLAHDRYGAEAVLAVNRWKRGGTYRGAVITRADSGIDSVAGLADKKVAMVDLHSMSGYVMPAVLLSKAKVKPAELVQAGTHDAVVRLVYEKKADAGFIYFNEPTGGVAHDARALILEEYPDVLDVVSVLGKTEPIPNEPIVVGKHVPKPVRDKLVAALIGLTKTEEGRALLMENHDIGGLHPVTDADYDGLRAGLQDLGKRIDEFVPGGGLLEVTHKTRIEVLPPVGN